MTTNTARSRFAGPRFSWWVGAGAVNDERQASARLATAQPGTFSLGVSPVPAALAGSACHAGEAAQRVLRLLEREKRTRAECYAAAAEVVGEADARIVVQRLARDSLIVATNQCYSITPRGLKRVPRASVVIQPMRPYVPPAAPPRRAGSMDFARYPSVAAGVARPYHAEGVL